MEPVTPTQKHSGRRGRALVRTGLVMTAVVGAFTVAANVPATHQATSFLSGPAAQTSGADRTGIRPSVMKPPAGKSAGSTVTGPEFAVPAPGSASVVDSGASTAPAKSTQANLPIGTPPGHVERSCTASYTVAHNGFAGAMSAVLARATALGGYVVASDTHADKDGRISEGTITIRVPEKSLSDLLAGLPADFQPSSVNFASVDHTAQFVDTDARLRISKLHEADLERALAAATSPSEIATLQGQVLQAQLEVDTQQGAINVINDQVQLSNATIGLSERGSKTQPVAPPASTPPPVTAVMNALHNDLLLLSGVLYVALTALPVLVILLPLFLVRRRIWRAVRTV